MKKRECMAKHIPIRNLPNLDDISSIMHQIFLGEHRPLGFARCSRRVYDEPGVVQPDYSRGEIFRGRAEHVDRVIRFVTIDDYLGEVWMYAPDKSFLSLLR